MSGSPNNDNPARSVRRSGLAAGTVLAFAAALCLALLGICRGRATTSTPERLFEITLTFALAALMIASAAGCGRLFLIKRAGEFLDDFAVSCGVGICALITIVIGLCATGTLGRPGLAVVAIVFALVGGYGLARFRRNDEQGKPPAREGGRGAIFWIAVLVAPISVWFLTGQFRGPDVDEIAYHFAVPVIYLEHGGFCNIPFNVYSNMPLGGEMLFTFCLGLGGASLARLVMSFFAPGIALFMVAITRRWFGDARAGLIAAILFFANSCCCYGPYVDFALTFWFLLSLYAFLQWRDCGAGNRLVISGFGAGMCMATKYTGLFPAATVGLLLLLHLAFRNNAAGAGLKPAPTGAGPDDAQATDRITGGSSSIIACFGLPALQWAVPAALMIAPWLIKNHMFTGNPVYPMLYEVFGGPDWTPNLHRNLLAWHREIGVGRSFSDYLLLPWNVAMHFDRVGYRYFAGFLSPAHLIFVPPGLILFWRNRRFRILLAASVLGWVFWSLGSQQVRFLLPALSVTMILAGLGASRMMSLASGKRATVVVKPIVSTIVLVLMLSVWREYILLSPQLLSAILEPGYSVESKGVITAPQTDAINYANKTIPPWTGRFLLIDFNGGYPLNQQYVFESFYEAPQIRELAADCSSPEALHCLLASKGFTHVMRQTRERSGLERFFATPEAEQRFNAGQRILDDYLTRFCALRTTENQVEIYEIITDRPSREAPPEIMKHWMPEWTGTGPGRW
ncbi:MAG TPA: hypothetical protein PL033_09535 [Candidatus Brocadiia bacterium]|nr:hypothetical protein [Candidatus Brocadiia bacterium]